MRTNINRRVLEVVAKGAATGATRYAIHGVLVERSGDATVAVSTDGRMLSAVVLPLENDSHEHGGAVVLPLPITIPRCKEGDKADGTTGPSYRLDTKPRGGSTAWCCEAIDRSRSEGEAVEGRFPDWRKEIPDVQGALRVNLNPQYLRTICDIVSQSQKATGANDGLSITLTVTDATRPVRIDWESKRVVAGKEREYRRAKGSSGDQYLEPCVKGVAVLMPIRMKPVTVELPPDPCKLTPMEAVAVACATATVEQAEAQAQSQS